VDRSALSRPFRAALQKDHLFVGVMLTWFWVGVQDLHHGADLPVDLSTIVIE
jgi:hypothetical protein